MWFKRRPRIAVWASLAAAFALIVVGADYAITRWAVYSNESSSGGRLHHLIVDQDPGEISILGSSKVYYDYVPAQMSLRAYNYGIPGSSLDLTDTLLTIELAKSRTTPIILDLKPEAEHGIGDPATYVPLVNDPRIRALLLQQGMFSWRYLVPGIRYFGYYDVYFKELLNDRAQLVRTVERGFSHERYWSFDPQRLSAAAERRARGTNGYFPDPEQNRRLIGQIEAHPDRLFILVYSPVHRSCLINFQNRSAFEAFKNRLNSLPNAVVMDFMWTAYPDQWFLDTNHLLYEGAVQFSRMLDSRITALLAERRLAGANRRDASK